MFFLRGHVSYFKKIFLIIYFFSFLDVLGRYCGMCALCGCGVWPSHGGDSSCGREQAPGSWASAATAGRKAVAAGGLSCVQASGLASCELSCSAARGICPNQGLNLCPPHWEADSHPLYHSAYSFQRLLPQKHSITA